VSKPAAVAQKATAANAAEDEVEEAPLFTLTGDFTNMHV
jgi:hypothetical protein